VTVPLRVLILEDNPSDADLILHELSDAGFQTYAKRVDTEQDYLAQINPQLDVILADYNLPQFDAFRALDLLKERELDVPFIVVSGSIGEDLAVTGMKRGATDYLLKDRLARLGPAVQHALEQRRLREEKRRTEGALKDSEERYRELFENANDIIYTHDFEGNFTSINKAVERIAGHNPNELLGRNIADLLAADYLHLAKHMVDRDLGEGAASSYEVEVVAKDDRRVPLEIATRLIYERGRPVAVQGTARDITERKKAEEELRESVEALRRTDAERRNLLAHLTRAQEEERSRIASDIHDDSIQVMTAVGIRLETLRRQLSDLDQLALVEELQQTVDRSISRLRSLLFELKPPALDRDGLAPALRMYLEVTGADGGFKYGIDNKLTGEPPLEIRTILYRIAQEALANVRKHAGARHVDVGLEERDGGYLVRVRDDGKGFSSSDLAQGPPPGHLGFTAMRERAESARGWWRTESSPGEGTVVEFWLPKHTEGEVLAP
jgi:PAS domain S-box-containing protein